MTVRVIKALTCTESDKSNIPNSASTASINPTHSSDDTIASLPAINAISNNNITIGKGDDMYCVFDKHSKSAQLKKPLRALFVPALADSVTQSAVPPEGNQNTIKTESGRREREGQRAEGEEENEEPKEDDKIPGVQR